MLKNSIYSVISPEGCSSILWRSPEFVQKAAESLKLTAEDCFRLGIIDEIIDETPGGAHRFKNEQYLIIKKSILNNLNELQHLSNEELVIKRNNKYLSITSDN